MQKTIAPLHAFAYNELAKGLMVQNRMDTVCMRTCAILRCEKNRKHIYNSYMNTHEHIGALARS